MHFFSESKVQFISVFLPWSSNINAVCQVSLIKYTKHDIKVSNLTIQIRWSNYV